MSESFIDQTVPNSSNIIKFRLASNGSYVPYELYDSAGTAMRYSLSVIPSTGGTPASTGVIRLPNAQAIYARNAANSADIPLLQATSGNAALLGGPSFPSTIQGSSISLGMNTYTLSLNDNGTATWNGLSLNIGGASPKFVTTPTEIFIANTTGAPAGTPSGGGYLYVENGALKYKGSSGTVTPLANA